MGTEPKTSSKLISIPRCNSSSRNGNDPMAQAVPSLRARFTSYRSWAEASMQQILGERFSTTKVLEANWLESTVFLNRGGHFEAKVLPADAQLAPAFGVSAADWDGDGNEDLFLAQNFFDAEPETPRYDSGRGVWLRGDGQGGFVSVPGQKAASRSTANSGAARCATTTTTVVWIWP